MFSRVLTTACHLVLVWLGLELGLGLGLVSGWLAVMHTYLLYTTSVVTASLPLTPKHKAQ